MADDATRGEIAKRRPSSRPARFEKYAEFEAYFRSFNSGGKAGDLMMSFGVPPEQKYAAFAVTDLEGVMVRVTIERKVRAPRTDPADPGDLAPDEGE